MNSSSHDERALVTFDFDDTLTCRRWDPENESFVHVSDNFMLIDLIRDLIANNFRVMIVTSRHFTGHSVNEIRNFTDRHDLTKDVSVKFTFGELKSSHLFMLGSIMHWDDDPLEVREARSCGIFCVLVPPPIGCPE